jgi:hypothetical protein
MLLSNCDRTVLVVDRRGGAKSVIGRLENATSQLRIDHRKIDPFSNR